MILLKLSCVLECVFLMVHADTYLHYPRGSNNRLREKSANRNNGNRVFDSQNNNRGGYNVGIREAGQDGNQESEQYQQEYFQSSTTGKTYMPIRWTSQHGSGGEEDTNPNKLNANFVIQVMLQPATTESRYERMRDGTSQSTQDYSQPQQRYDRTLRRNIYKESSNTFINRRNNRVRTDRVLQEPFEWYDKCRVRERNKGLFTADQNVNNNQGSTATRQNPNGQRRGYECPEERDHFPYWHPSPWVDIMVYSKNASMCDYYKKESFNTKNKWECVENFQNGGTSHYSNFNNQADCTTGGGQWLEFSQYLEILEDATTEAACNAKKAQNPGTKIEWARPINLNGNINKKCLVKPPALQCAEYPFGRVNHLGNGADLGEIGYSWEIPHFPSGKTMAAVFRTRYNITTDDYDGWSIDSRQNGNEKSPVVNNPNAYFGASEPLALAINTAQFGRTFQDRSHKFYLKPRPASMAANDIKILSVQGKRGNIVQTYPGVEYDFVPKNLETKTNELIHVLWTGSNTHDNNPPGGDGQTGDDGEGQGGTDRSNILGMRNRLDNWPIPDDHPENFLNHIEVKWSAYSDQTPTAGDLGVQLASSGYFKDYDSVDSTLQNQLNNASPSFKGAVFRIKKKGTYHYMCSRNNNFSNRSQKGSFVVS